MLLKTVQFVCTNSGTVARKGSSPFDKIRLDFCLLPPEFSEKAAETRFDEGTEQRSTVSSITEANQGEVTLDDFYDDSVFDLPSVQRDLMLFDDFYDDSVFQCPAVIRSLDPLS